MNLVAHCEFLEYQNNYDVNCTLVWWRWQPGALNVMNISFNNWERLKHDKQGPTSHAHSSLKLLHFFMDLLMIF